MATTTRPETGTVSKAAGWLALAVLCAAQFMLIVDIVVLNVALPSIKRGLDVADAQLPLASVGYTLTFGSVLIVAGRAGDLFGRRRLFLTGLAVFTLASLLTGIVQEPWQLFVSRAVQGLGAGMVSPTALALLTSVFPEGPARNRAMGLWAAVGSGGAIAGQLLGGVITDVFGWRWIFFLNVPVGVLAAGLARRLIPESRPGEHARLDVTGAATLAVGVAGTSLALSRLSAHGADLWFAVGALVAVVAWTTFVRVERRHPAPLVRFGLLRSPGVWNGNAILALLAGATGAALFFTTLYLQVVLDYSPLDVGMAFAPVTAIVLVVSPLAGRLVSRVGVRRLLVAGAAISGLGLVYLAWIDAGGSYLRDVLPGLSLVALGNGLAFAPTMIAATSRVPRSDQGLASGLLSTSQELGTALGLAVLAAVATGVSGASTDPSSLGAVTSGYRVGFLGAAALMGLAVLAASRVPRDVGQADPASGDVTSGDATTVKDGERPPVPTAA